MKIEFDSARDSAIDAAAIARAMMIYVQNAAGQQQAQTGNQFTAPHLRPSNRLPIPFSLPVLKNWKAIPPRPARSTRVGSLGMNAFTPRRATVAAH
jgi:hypothetical protein